MRPIGARWCRKAEGATIYFADEAGIRSDYHAGTTWAPIGRTPVVKATGARFSLNMLSAVSAQGARRFMVHEGTVNAAVFIDFCRRLLRDHPGPVYLLVDGHPAHRARATTEFVASTEGRLRLWLNPPIGSVHHGAGHAGEEAQLDDAAGGLALDVIANPGREVLRICHGYRWWLRYRARQSRGSRQSRPRSIPSDAT